MKLFIQHIAVSLIFLLTSGSISLAQNYSSIFGLSITKWEMPFCNLDQAYVKEQISEMESVINGVNYKNVGTVYSGGVSYDLTGIDANGFAREDLTSGKAWFMSTIETMGGIDTLEFLIMDLSLSVDDTFLIYQPWNEVITSIIDSVYFISGVKHVQTNYHFWGSDEPLTFIEGVGTNYGLGYMHDSYNMCRCLISINKDLDEVYSNSNCFPPSVGNEDLTEEVSVTVFPNPSSTYVTIESNAKGVQQYAIYSILGEKVMNGIINSNRIDISGLPSSSYILRIGNQSFKLFVTK
jgi:hypothetical protein